MLTSGQINRHAAYDQQTGRNPATLEQVLRGLEIFRKCRLQRVGATASNIFTLEDILYQLEEAWSHTVNIPHALYGAIAVQAQKRNIITHVGYARATRDASKHREVRSYCWSNYDNIQPVKSRYNVAENTQPQQKGIMKKLKK